MAGLAKRSQPIILHLVVARIVVKVGNCQNDFCAFGIDRVILYSAELTSIASPVQYAGSYFGEPVGRVF
jgi:hypothetical protein